METEIITIELPSDEALALAQLCKRIGFSDVRGNAIDTNEAYTMLDAVAKLQKSLARQGYNPR